MKQVFLFMLCAMLRGQILAPIASANIPGTPVDSPGTGSYSSTQSVTVASSNSSTVYYGGTGVTPNCLGTAGTLYTGAFNISATTTLSTIGCNGITSGPVHTSVYTISGATISQVGTTVQAAGSGGGTSAAISSTSGATLLVGVVSAFLSSFGATQCTDVPVTDSFSNSWQPTTTAPIRQAGTLALCIWYAYSHSGGALATGSSHTFTIGSGGLFYSAEFAAWSGTLTTSAVLDSATTGVGGGTSGTSLATGSVTPSVNGELLIAALSSEDGTGPYTINASFTGVSTQLFTGGMYFGSGFAYLIQTTATAVNPTWTQGSSTNLAVNIVGFEP